MAARPRLIDLLKDPDFHVRWMALDALANLRHPDDVPTFERYFLGTEDAMGTPRESNQDVQVLALRRTAATGLYRTGGPKAVEILQRGLSDPEPILRRTCAFGLGMLKERQAVPAILKALDDEDAGVREKADLALQQISGRRVGFDPHGLPLKREIGKTKWQAWWESAAKEPAP
jgi:HEAT repeat protein